tara:strand:- start:1036 stop:1206 length:171 start_codon:yes stop_codon:yes gene_type:complete
MYEEALNNVAAEQGWNTETKMKILLDFLNESSKDRIEQFEDKINKIADFENQHSIL